MCDNLIQHIECHKRFSQCSLPNICESNNVFDGSFQAWNSAKSESEVTEGRRLASKLTHLKHWKKNILWFQPQQLLFYLEVKNAHLTQLSLFAKT